MEPNDKEVAKLEVEAVVQEVRVEHVLAALDHIVALCEDVRRVMEKLDRGMVITTERSLARIRPNMPRQDDNCQ